MIAFRRFNNECEAKPREAESFASCQNEDVEFAAEVADRDDFEAAERAKAADHRQEEN